MILIKLANFYELLKTNSPIYFIFALADAKEFIKAPSLASAGWLALDAVSFLDPTGLASTAAHAVKATKAAKSVVKVVHNVDEAVYAVKSVEKVAGEAKILAKGAGETAKVVPNPFGKSGGPAHQGKIQEIAEEMRSKGYDVRHESTSLIT